MIKNSTEPNIEDNRVIYNRYFDVPIELLFELWSEEEHLNKWWGPDGFTLTTIRLDFRVGGIWEFVMHGPDGRNYKNKVQYLQIQKPNIISYKHIGDEDGFEDVNFVSNILFENSGEGTNFRMEQIFSTKEELERVNTKYGAIEGAKQHIANFANYARSKIS
ncbi:SRPBCC domain-containing protein [Leptospira sp. 96542]|nr:SRPBCC domain-containing protein [Leptospira sp. 96542]